MKHGKKYRAMLDKIAKDKLYTVDEACALMKETSVTSFDSSVEIHLNLGIDPKQAEQQMRDTVALPHGTGKEVRVVAFVSDDKVKEAVSAGAIKAGNEELIAEIEKGWLEFDVAVATPDMMKGLGKIARTLGQKGLMPNPKAGTVTQDVSKTIEEIRKGKVEFRNDKNGNLHNIVGKVSFGADNLAENVKVYLRTIIEHKPKDIKGVFVKSITLATTMGPAVHVDHINSIKEL
ncbi:50S ribosomal protein L1 [Candidatus Peregrinibacteria bacterium CG22_combo_CG10-13_8_21_14_all_44_10]|nr:MAG: 50S ribosomal protein L1 [Candidatus Peregrinibacteria bacterium CG2_30_44_17]PIP66629.1 MAG: 50S ribosomal protein L1 [Candidatus Peregrinibacteria bacterium CG22_combo_CG10-13_8_21_14_all_44_10]PIS03880.1 MAG: 50S ribosomal protein L1 [Candidatus Peregrinibacteria bacterium CG10_big_fil_rev_8_21_14_0_10_44_7]PIX79944.1 MAG: 50S ribosomal protein L1 [Candidatus Peregrinibacteria bacterium CG_4_10_14_3_um_filter_44_21]PJB88306.1 MAG: 50S ribosomal protein L1 [Candidatus Peregrinibacteri